MKRKSASPSKDARTGKWRLHFSYQGKLYRRFYIDNQRDAELLQEEVNYRVRRLKLGLDSPLPGQALADFVFGEAYEEPIPTTPPPTDKTLLILAETYQKSLVFPLKALSTIRTEKTHLRHLCAFLGVSSQDPTLKSVTVDLFREYKTWRYANGVRTDTVRKELATFQAMLQMAVDAGEIPANVVRDVKRDKSQAPCDRFRTHGEILSLIRSGQYSEAELREIRRFQYLTLPEIETLIDLAEGSWLHSILITFAYTGMRRGELVQLEWSDVDLDERCLYVRSKKQSRAACSVQRRVPIHDRLLPVLREQYLKTGGARWVFAGPGSGGQLKTGTLRESFRRLLNATEFEGVGFHVFRHSIASNLAARGVEQHYIDSILGHQTEAMRKRYQHLFPERVEAALRMISVL